MSLISLCARCGEDSITNHCRRCVDVKSLMGALIGSKVTELELARMGHGRGALTEALGLGLARQVRGTRRGRAARSISKGHVLVVRGHDVTVYWTGKCDATGRDRFAAIKRDGSRVYGFQDEAGEERVLSYEITPLGYALACEFWGADE